MDAHRLKSLLHWMVRIFQSGLWNGILLIVSILLHLVCVMLCVNILYVPKPASATPELIIDSLELTLAEVASETVVDAVEETQAPTASATPTPEIAPYLTDDTSPIVLPDPPLSSLELPKAPLPEMPQIALPQLPNQPTDLPEITLPPMTLPPPEMPKTKSQPRQSTGATARVKAPKLLTDLTSILKEYPEEARRNHWQGTVKLRLKINAHGRTESIEVIQSSGYPVLDRQARKMLRRARFSGGPGELEQTIEYSLTK